MIGNEKEKAIKSIENYTLFNTILDENSLGIVQKAKIKEEAFAFTIIPKELIKGNSCFFDEIYSDIRKFKQIDHSNVLRFMALIETPNTYYLSQEITNEGTLFDYIHKKTSLSEDETFEIFIQILSGYKEFLLRNCIHANLTSQTIYKLKKKFMIPESIKNEIIGYSYDFWSVGVILSEMLFGEPITKAQNLDELIKKHESLNSNLKNLILTHHLSNECGDFLQGILKREEKNRLFLDQIIKHSFFLMQKERLKHYLLDNITDHLYDINHNKQILEEIMRDKTNIFRKDFLKDFGKTPNNFGYYCKIYKKVIQLESILSKFNRKTSIDEEMNNIDENVRNIKVPLSLSDIDKYMVRSSSMSPTKHHKKTTSVDLTLKLLTEIPNLILEESKSIHDEDLYENHEEDEVVAISKKNETTLIDLHEINSKYKRSKQKKLSIILEKSIEVSTTIPKEVNLFEESLKEMVYTYFHEKELMEFIVNVANEMQRDADLTSLLHEFVMIKFSFLRITFLLQSLIKKENVMKFSYWEQFIESPLFNSLKEMFKQDENKYKILLNGFKMSSLIKECGNSFDKDILQLDLSIKQNIFLKELVSLLLLHYELFAKKSKINQDKNKTLNMKFGKMAFKIVSIAKMVKELGFDKWDTEGNYDLGIFKEKLMSMTIKEINDHSLKIRSHI